MRIHHFDYWAFVDSSEFSTYFNERSTYNSAQLSLSNYMHYKSKKANLSFKEGQKNQYFNRFGYCIKNALFLLLWRFVFKFIFAFDCRVLTLKIRNGLSRSKHIPKSLGSDRMAFSSFLSMFRLFWIGGGKSCKGVVWRNDGENFTLVIHCYSKKYKQLLLYAKIMLQWLHNKGG